MLKTRRFFALVLPLLLRDTSRVLAASQPTLAYRFEPGDWLVYEIRSERTALATGAIAERCFSQVEIWCLAEQNGEAQLLLDLIRLVDERPEPMRGFIMCVDSRGRSQIDPASQEQAVEMRSALDLLPVQASVLEDEETWTTPPDLLGGRLHCRRHDEQAGTIRVDYDVAFPPGDGELLGRSRSGRYWFDPEARCVTRIEITETDTLAGWRAHSSGVLRSRSRKPAGWAARRVAEAEQHLLALRRERGLLTQIQDRPETVEQALRSLDSLWAARAAQAGRETDSPLQILARASRQRWSAEGDRLRRNAAYAQTWLGRAAVPWTLLDTHGQQISSEAFRSGPCVELLWSAGAPLSVAMLSKLQSERAQQPETPVICLNMDHDTSIARKAAAQLPASLTHVLAGPIEAVEQPVDLPILRVLDRDGRIVRIWIGWQPSCAEAFAEARRRGQ